MQFVKNECGVKKVYGCTANVKFRLRNIFLKKPFYLGKKRDENPTVTRQVLMNFKIKVQKSECSVSEPLFVYSFQSRSKVFVSGGRVSGVQGHAPPENF